jgi:hypothetical protein
MALIIAGAQVEVPDLEVRSWKDDPKLKLKQGDYRKRPDTWVRGIILHTTKGIPGGRDKRPQDIRPGVGPDTGRDERLPQMWAMDNRKAGAHLIVDHDASVVCAADLQWHAAFHAGNVNNVTIGIEIYQGSKAEMYEGQLEATVRLVDFLTKTFSIQRQMHWPYGRQALKRGLKRGLDMVGVFGHRDVSNNRGEGDPGNPIMGMLRDAGYESFNFAHNEDKEAWEERQEALDLLPDGMPGPKTAAALLKAGRPFGLWVDRPGD